MTGNEHSLLASEELEFLLEQATVQCQQEELPGGLSQSENARVTIRGDLDKINLSDIFQTLSMSKMEGVLRVRHLLETREIFFHEGQVRYQFPSRSELKRLGQRLIRSGLISPDSLRLALLSQKKDSRPLGQILIDQEVITQDQLDGICDHQLQEDLYDVITWVSGDFEFYKGSPEDPVLLERFENAPKFDVSGILMEVARRSDEWENILANINSVDEIPIIPEEIDFPELTGNHLAVAEAIDGRRSVRDLAETTMLGMFQASRAVRDLYLQELIEFASTTQLLDIAKSHIDDEDIKRALLILHNLQQHSEEFTMQTIDTVATLLDRCGETKLAAKTLLHCAEQVTDPDDQLEVVMRARALDKSSIPVLKFLRTIMQEKGDNDSDDYVKVILDLANALSEIGGHEDALDTLAEAEALKPKDRELMTRKAVLLHKTGKTEEAIDTFLSLAQQAKDNGNTPALIHIYEQILKIDPRRKDINKTLRDLKTGKAKLTIRKIGMALAACLLLVGMYFYYQSYQESQRMQEVATKVRTALRANDIQTANMLINAAAASLGNAELLDDLNSEVRQVLTNQAMADLAKRNKVYLGNLDDAANLLNEGKLLKAFAIYEQMVENPESAKLVKKFVPPRLRLLLEDVEVLATKLQHELPEAPSDLHSDAERLQNLAALTAKLQIDVSVASGIVAAKEHKVFSDNFKEEEILRMAQTADLVLELRQSLRTRKLAYERYQKKLDLERSLEPSFEAAQTAEINYDFKKAEELYRQLRDEYPSDNALRAQFADRVRRYAAINHSLALLQKATANGDFNSAQGHFHHLRRSFEDIAFERVVRLPIRVITNPPGATVKLNGESIGQSPLLTSYSPAEKTKVEILLENFLPEETSITGDSVGLVRSFMARSPAWKSPLQGMVERTPSYDAEGRVFIVDRGGYISAIDPSAKRVLWSKETNDLSGMLTQPQVHENLVIVGSVDGPLRALDRSNGKLIWKVDGLHCESSPAICGNNLVLITTDNRLLTMDLQSQEQHLISTLPHPVRVDIQASGNNAIIACNDGQVHCLNAVQNRILWTIKLDRGVPTKARLHQKMVILANDEGVVTSLQLRSGKVIWKTRNLGEIRWAPTIHDNKIYVASDKGLHVLSLGNGRLAKQLDEKHAWATDLAVSPNGQIMAGTHSGSLLVLDPTSLKILYQLRGKGAATAPPLFLKNGSSVVGFENREFHVYGPLP